MLERLQPREVFQWFEEISMIPRGSGHVQRIQGWCVSFAEERGLSYRTDAEGNVVIYKAGSAGCEHEAPLILQAHLDMVCVKEEDCTLDMASEGLALRTDGEKVWAEGTSLGADNGIGAAMILAVLDSRTLVHPPIEAVLTADEETGMYGAKALANDWIKGRRLLNLDSEKEGILYAGCAGGESVRCSMPVNREPFEERYWMLSVRGGTGGHSGINIGEGRANAVILLGRLLAAAERDYDFRLVTLEGGTAGNAIPGEASAVLAAEQGTSLREFLMSAAARLRDEFNETDPQLEIDLSEQTKPTQFMPMDRKSTKTAADMLCLAPNGVQVMSTVVEGLPQTSLNLGVVRCSENEMTFQFSCRSSVTNQLEMIKEKLRRLCNLLGGSTEFRDRIPAWEYRADSVLRETAVRIYEQKTGHEPKVTITHAGAECGIFCGKWPEMDCVSYGPDITHVHSTQESVNAGSVQRTWEFVICLLAELGKQEGQDAEESFGHD